MTAIERVDSNGRMSQVVIHGETIYLAGQIGEPGDSAREQADQALARIDDLLARCGSSREYLLHVTIWMANMSADFAAVDAAWNDWVPAHAAPARAAGEAKLALPELKVEITAVAARP